MKNIIKLNDVEALSPAVEAGVKIYSKPFLAVYDLILHNITTYLAWQCPTPRVLAFFRQYLSKNHLDVGVGTGFFLKNCLNSPESQRVALMDLNPNCLHKAASVLPRYRVEKYQANVLQAVDFTGQRFDSCSLMHLLHCVPGSIREKSVVFDHIAIMLNPGATIFGITILRADNETNGFGRLIIANSNNKGHFCNGNDSMAGLEEALQARYANCDVQRIGQLALFKAQVPG